MAEILLRRIETASHPPIYSRTEFAKSRDPHISVLQGFPSACLIKSPKDSQCEAMGFLIMIQALNHNQGPHY